MHETIPHVNESKSSQHVRGSSQDLEVDSSTISEGARVGVVGGGHSEWLVSSDGGGQSKSRSALDLVFLRFRPLLRSSPRVLWPGLRLGNREAIATC